MSAMRAAALPRKPPPGTPQRALQRKGRTTSSARRPRWRGRSRGGRGGRPRRWRFRRRDPAG
eukprot:188151-Alexandrium_andersonii.AAC.1